jgi:hypothetical protein
MPLAATMSPRKNVLVFPAFGTKEKLAQKFVVPIHMKKELVVQMKAVL